ncbi:DNA polymerase III subunit gamma/tau [Patescibacteria group bacterium]|nr:DNA polymerase III subunit gamma/tau [Patescibacteria group bacterium]
MSTTLYRKYRPQTFAEVINQNHVKVTLRNEVASGKLAHAYLFSGPRGIGKTTMARILAKSVNCPNQKKAEPCNKCQSCLEITQGNCLDLIEIDAASNRGINEIRELREHVKYAPSKNKYKVFIIDEVHMLTAEAFNALLKTLEEPPGHVIFILATTELHQLPETIISRCQRFDFRKISFKEIAGHLEMIAAAEKVKVAKKVIETIARTSEGYVRDAISLLGQILALGEKEISEAEASLVLPRSDINQIIIFIKQLLEHQSAASIRLINQYLNDGGELENFTKEAIEVLRKILVAKVTDGWQELAWEVPEEESKSLMVLLEKVEADYLVQVIEILLEALTRLKRADIIQLPLEMAIVKISELKSE